MSNRELVQLDVSNAKDTSSEKKSGPCFWLSIFATITGLLLFLDLVSGLRIPASFVYWLNPVAWLSNALGLTARMGGFLLGMDQAVASLASFVGIPVVGSFVLWIAAGCFSWRYPGLMFLLWAMPSIGALQLTAKRSYEAMAEHYHAEQRTELEAAALSKALFVVRCTGIADPDMERLSSRLSKIETTAARRGL